MMYLRIPSTVLLDFSFARFADHVLDHSPAYATRSLLRLGIQARDAVAAAKDGVAEMSDEAGKLFQQACEQAPVPRLVALTSNGQAAIPATAFETFYVAVETMTTEKPECKDASSSPSLSPDAEAKR